MTTIPNQVTIESPRGTWPELPRLRPNQKLDEGILRDRLGSIYSGLVWVPSAVLVVILVLLLANNRVADAVILVCVLLAMAAAEWLSWKLGFAHLKANAVQVGPDQYSHLHELVCHTAEFLRVEPVPTVLVLQGHGLVELLVSKLFARRGLLVITSNLLDEMAKCGTSREFMFVVGRQIGLMRIGFFRFWLARHFLGRFAFLAYNAWERRCHLIADRVGLLVAGEPYASEQALLVLTVGAALAPSTNNRELEEQRHRSFESVWTWLALAFSSYPYMLDRLHRLREFARATARLGPQLGPTAIATLPLLHRPIRAVEVMIIHGHDVKVRAELESFLLRTFPHVSPLAMISEVNGASTLPEKFEELAARVRGAIALLTPDDRATTERTGIAAMRPRQNAIVEVSWFWGRFGRARCLLLTRGAVELPSDLSGVELHTFHESPTECAESLRKFIAQLDAEPRG